MPRGAISGDREQQERQTRQARRQSGLSEEVPELGTPEAAPRRGEDGPAEQEESRNGREERGG